MTIGAPELHWLPAQPPDWRSRLAVLMKRPDGALGGLRDALRQARALAGFRLDFTMTNALDRAASGLDPQPIKLAVLASSTTAHLAGALRVAALRRGFAFAIHEPPYGQLRQVLADPQSDYHRFAPAYALFAFDADTVAARAAAAAATNRAAVRGAADALVGEWRELWAQARRAGACVLQQTVMPRVVAGGGSNDHRLPSSGAAFIALVNERLCDAADDAGIDLVAIDAQLTVDGVDAWFNTPTWHAAKQEVALPAAPYYGDLVARVVAARRGRGAKCCVFDLDDTLWCGVIGDDGLGGIQIGQGSAAGEAHLSLQRYALDLRRRGILLAFNSKNDEAVARAVFDRHPDMLLRTKHLSCFVANWNDKATNLQAIAGALRIGIDALVFVDDNPFEREQVRAALPECLVPELPEDPALVPRCLAASGYFELASLTAEDLVRGELYAAEARRGVESERAVDIGGYLSSLGMVLHHAEPGETDVARATQLINKTNQFNLTTRRLSEDQVRAIAADPARLIWGFRLSDRFGDSGLIAVVSGHRVGTDSFMIDDWLMSCRVIGRDVEYARPRSRSASSRSTVRVSPRAGMAATEPASAARAHEDEPALRPSAPRVHRRTSPRGCSAPPRPPPPRPA